MGTEAFNTREDFDTLIRRLIAGREVEEIVIYDVSDCQLYGSRHSQRLTGELAHSAEAAGCELVAYQSIYWFTLAYIPVWPMATFLVLPRQTCDDPDGDAEQYRAVSVPMDWGQVAFHLAFVPALVACVLAVVAWRWQ